MAVLTGVIAWQSKPSNSRSTNNHLALKMVATMIMVISRVKLQVRRLSASDECLSRSIRLRTSDVSRVIHSCRVRSATQEHPKTNEKMMVLEAILNESRCKQFSPFKFYLNSYYASQLIVAFI